MIRFRCRACRSVFYSARFACQYCKTAPLVQEQYEPQTLVSVPVQEPKSFTHKGKSKRLPKEPTSLKPLRSLKVGEVPRFSSRVPVLDRALGTETHKGVVRGAFYLVFGVPGAGKSTLLLQAFDHPLTEYYTNEESVFMIADRAARLGTPGDALSMRARTLQEIEEQHRPKTRVTIVDSVQEIQVGLEANTIDDVREASRRLSDFAQRTRQTLFVICHSTKDEGMAGPQTLAHGCDAIIELSITPKGQRFLVVKKNRFGESHVSYPYVMTNKGLDFGLRLFA